MFPSIAFLILIISFLALIVYSLVRIVKHLIIKSRLGKAALLSIGNEVSIYEDKGAKFAYKGIFAYLNEDPLKALGYFDKAVKHSTMSQNNAFCLDWMSQCYEAQNKPSESLNCCVKAVEVEPSNVKSLFNLADMYVKKGLFSKAEFYYNRILRYEKENTLASFMLGTLLMGRGLYDDAEEQFLKTLDIDNSFAPAMAELSVIMAIKGDYSQMDSYFTKAKGKIGSESDRLDKRLNSIKRMRELCNGH